MLDQLTPLITASMGLPLQYGGMYNNAFNPYYGYMTSQGNNMAQLGGQGLGAYTNLMGQQSAERQSAMPLQLQAQMFNAVAPALSGLLSQYVPGAQPIGSINFSGPGGDGGMGGFHSLLGQAYSQARGYDSQFQDQFDRNLGMLPKAPYMNSPGPSAPPRPAAPNVPIPSSAGGPAPSQPGLMYKPSPAPQLGPPSFAGMPTSPQVDPSAFAPPQAPAARSAPSISMHQPGRGGSPVSFNEAQRPTGRTAPSPYDPRVSMENLNRDFRNSFDSQRDLSRWAGMARAR